MSTLLIICIILALLCFGLGFAVKVLFYVAAFFVLLAIIEWAMGLNRRR